VSLLTIHLSGDFRDIIGRWQAKRLKFQIPSLAELKAFVDQPLLDNEKIPLDPERFQSLINMTTPGGDWCSRDDVEALFRSEDGYSVLDQFFFIVSEAPPHSGTESTFHSFWDANVRKILELLLPGGRSMRDSSRHTATGLLRPDFAFILYNLCPFRGEEKPPGSNDDPRAELSTKLAWAYDPAPYVLGHLMSPMFLNIFLIILSGYYANGARITLVAITPSGLNNQPVVHNIVDADLSLRRDRIKNICRLINIAGVLQHLAELVRPLDAEFELLERFSLLIVQVFPTLTHILFADNMVLWKSRAITLSRLLPVQTRSNVRQDLRIPTTFSPKRMSLM
jgi:hypothetical protein